MAKWNRVISGFDAEDETANFGTRNFAESDGSIYETWTLATIESDGNCEDESRIKHPNVTASIWNERMCVAVDTCITIFLDQTCQNVLSSIGFDTPITSYCLSSDGSYLCVTVEDAILHCFTLLHGGQQMFTIDFKKEYKCPRIVKVCLREVNSIDVIVITSMGNIYRVNGIDQALTMSQNFDSGQITKNIDLVEENLSIKYAVPIDSDGYVNDSCDDDEMALITVGEKLCIVPDGISCNLRDLPYKYAKIQFFNNYKAMVCLRTDGYLSTVCITTLLETKIWDCLVKDFLTIQEKSHDSNQMLVLMAPKNNETSVSLHLMSFPDFNIIYTMTVSSSTYLVDIIGGTIERLLFLEGIQTSDGSLDVIRIKAIEESMPELRLERLLRQKRFDDARAFANKFKLDIERIFRAEATMFMNCLRPRANNKENIDLDTFKTILDKINNIEFIYQCCNNTLTCDYRDTRNLVEYARKRIIEFINGHHEIEKSSYSGLLQDASDTLRRLETFEIIQRTKLNGQANDQSDINEWYKFSKANLLDECIRCLSLGELRAAALIWIRHTPNFAKVVTRNTVIDILTAIPDNLQPYELWPWLRHFIPSVTSFFPGALAEIIHWGCKKTRTLETFHRGVWPDIGLKFANGLIDLLRFDEYNVCFQFHQQYANKNSQFHQLTKLVQAMSDLLELKTRYNVILPLNTYLGDPVDVISLVLSKVHVDGLTNLMENFVQKYILNNSLQNDKVLSSFIQNTLRNSKDWWLWEKAPWDKRLAVVISYIHNIQNRLQQTLQVLKKAPVPWSEALVQLAEQSYINDHPLVSQIRFESNSVVEKLILKKYGFAHTRQCLNLFRSIVKQNRISMIDDIFELTKTDHALRTTVLHFCISYHLKQGNIDNVMNIFEQLSDDIVVKCCEQLVCVTKSRLNFSICRDEKLEYDMIMEVLISLESRMRESLARNPQHSMKLNIFLDTILNMRDLYRLKEELNICIDMNVYIRHKERTVIDYVRKIIDVNNRDELSWQSICKKIRRAEDLLHLPKLFGLYHLLHMCKNSITLKSYISGFLGDYSEIVVDEPAYASKICSLLVEEPENDPKIPGHLRNLCSSFILYSVENNLRENLQLGICVDAYNEAMGTQFDPDSSLTSSKTRNSVRQLYPIYRDVSVSSGCTLLPLLRDGLKIYTFYRNRSQGDKLSDPHSEEEAMVLLSQSFIDRVSAVQNEHHDYSLLRIIATIYFQLCSLIPQSEKSIMGLHHALNHCAYSMLKKVVNNKVFDLQLGLTCLFLLPEEESLNLLSSISKFSQTDYARDRLTKDLGYEYCRLMNNADRMEKFKWQRVLHYWAQRLADYGILYRDTLDSDTKKKREILDCVMKTNKAGTIELLRDFCQNFGFNLDDCYLLYLQTLLRSWQPKYDSGIAINGQSELKIDLDNVRELAATCRKIAAQICDKARMKCSLVQMLPLINFYHYEIFLILLELGEDKKIETKCHLCFLQNYTRVGVPTDIERDEWGKFSQENESLPAIAQWRMPFLPKVDQYKLITPELNLKTYEKWLTIAAVLRIPIHNICTLAVMGAVTDAWKNDDKKNKMKWSINMRNSQLLKDIKKCINCITGQDRWQYSTAALYYVVNHTPPGADLVAAAKECYLYSQQWQQESLESASTLNNKMSKINEKWMRYTCQHILHTQGLGQEKYLNLVANPGKLVQELYTDETIPLRYKCAIGNRPDINSAVDALGKLFSLNLIKVRLELLNTWLQPWENPNNAVNDSISENFTRELSRYSTTDASEMDDNFLRACYIVSSGDTDSFVNYLIDIGFPEDREDCYESGVRFRALRVLQSITDEETLQDYVKRDIQTVNHYTKTLQYLSELEKFGLHYSVEGFNTCSKHKLVQLLIDSQYDTPRALGLVPQLYIDYKIDDYKFLAVALERMVKLSLVKELTKTLSLLGPIDCIANTSNYTAAWQLVVNDAFNKLHAQSSTDIIDSCIETLRLLHACPVIDKLEFSNVITCCVLAKQWHLAAAFLPFLSDARDHELIIQKFRRDEISNEISSKLMELEVKGILLVRQAMIILQQASILTYTN